MTKIAPILDSNIDDIKRRSLVGIVALTSRTFVLQIIALVATFILTILLEPAVFGIFFVVTAAINFLNYFSDIGLAAALIQKHEEPTRVDYVTTFTIQQLLVGLAVVAALLLSRSVVNIYGLGEEGLFLFRALVISFFLSSLKTIPSVILERRLDFHKLVLPQIVETTLFYVTAIVLALKGFGVVSFAWAALIRGISGTSLLYVLAPWRPGFALVWTSARQLLTFGVPYQANSFLALIKDDAITMLLGLLLPFAQVGYIGWAKKWAEIALRLIMDNIIKVTFPAFSRLQNNSEMLTKAIEKALLLLSLLTLPIAVGMLILIEPVVQVVPRYAKWEPALISFYLFTVSSVLATLSSPLVNALNAIGKVKYTFYLMLMWTALTWLLVPTFVLWFGFNGVALAAVIIGLTSFIPIVLLRRFVTLEFGKQLKTPAIATGVMAVVVFLVSSALSNAWLEIIFGVSIGGGIYILIINYYLGDKLKPYLQLLRNK